MSFPPEKIRNVALVGHGGSGKTTLAEALLHSPARSTRLGRVEDGTTVCDHDPEEQARGFSLSLGGGAVRVEGPQGQPHRHARATPTSWAMCTPRCGWPIWRCSWSRRSTASQVQTEVLWRAASELGRAPDGVRQQARPGASGLRAHPRRAAGPVRCRYRARSSCRSGPRPTSGAWPTCSPTRPGSTTAASAVHGEIPDDMEALEHQVHDNLVEGIVVADDDLMERYLEGDMPSVEQLERTLAVGVDRGHACFPVVCGSATGEVGIDRLADFLCEIGPSPLDRPTGRGDRRRRHRRGAPDPAGQAAGARVQDDRRPVRRSRHAVQGAVRHDPHRRPSRQHPLRHRRAAPRPLPAARSRTRSRSARSWRATSPRCRSCPPPRPATRWRRRARRSPSRPSSSPSRCSASRSRPARRATTTSWPTPCPGCSTRIRRSTSAATTRPTRRSCAGSARPTWRWPSTSCERKFGVAVDTEDVLIAVPGDHHRPARRRGPAQEAVGRPWPVRRLLDPGRALDREARASSSSTRSSAEPSPAGLHPGRAAGHRGGDGVGRCLRLPGGRPPGGALRRQGALGRLVRDGVPGGRTSGPPGGAWPRPTRCCSSRCSQVDHRRADRASRAT